MHLSSTQLRSKRGPPKGRHPPTVTPPGATSHAATPPRGHPADGHLSRGHPADGHLSRGHPADGHLSRGQARRRAPRPGQARRRAPVPRPSSPTGTCPAAKPADGHPSRATRPAAIPAEPLFTGCVRAEVDKSGQIGAPKRTEPMKSQGDHWSWHRVPGSPVGPVRPGMRRVRHLRRGGWGVCKGWGVRGGWGVCKGWGVGEGTQGGREAWGVRGGAGRL
jgi:hypothetical protein